MSGKENTIFIHDSVVTPNFQRGVDRCYINYTSALAKTFSGHILIYSNRTPFQIQEKQIFLPSKYINIKIPRKIKALIDIEYGQYIADRSSEIYYSPFYGWIKTHIPQVFTAHDMIFEKFPNYFSNSKAKRFIVQKKRCFDRAEMILCVSQNTANDIKEIYPYLQENKIKVVYNGIDEIFLSENTSFYSGKPYFLFVGNRSEYKNFIRLLIAFGKSGLSKDFSLRVICPLNDFPTAEEIEIIQKYHLEQDIHFEVSVTDTILKKYYYESFAFVLPSEYEGFGFPLLEAMASGTVVIASNTSSIPEIGGDVPIYFNPTSIDSIIESLIYTTKMSDSERLQRIKNGKSRSSLFTWNRSQEKFIEIIKSIL